MGKRELKREGRGVIIIEYSTKERIEESLMGKERN